MKGIGLGVNLDHIATLRQARMEGIPDLIEIAKIVLKGGADSIVAHLREDRRHMQDKDIYDIRKLKARFDMEMAATEEMLDIALDVKPDLVTLVPEKRQELTTEGGLDVAGNADKIARYVRGLGSKGIHVSLFIDPVQAQIEAAKHTGATFIEIHTGKYAYVKSGKENELQHIKKSVKLAIEMGLKVNAGHGLNYENVSDIAAIPGIEELNIGFSIIARAVETGIKDAVSKMKELIIASHGKANG